MPPGTPLTDIGWPIDAGGLTEALIRLRDEYGNPQVFVTENGACYNAPIANDGTVHDQGDAVSYGQPSPTNQPATPIVGIVTPSYTLTIDPYEVAEAFEVPLAYILDKRNHNRQERESAGRTRVFFVLPYEGRNIWGATAGMLVNLAEVLVP